MWLYVPIPAAVKPKGPMEINYTSVKMGREVLRVLVHTTPGRCMSRGSFCVMSLYINAAEIIKAMRQPVPCVVAAPKATAGMLRESGWPEASAATMRLAARGAVRRRG